MGGPLITGGESFLTSPIPGPLATHAEPPEEHTRATSEPLSAAPDPPAWPTLWHPIDMAQELYNNFRPLGIPELEYSPMEYHGLHIDHLGPFSIDSARPPVCPGLGSSTHPPSGGLVNGPDSKQLRGFSEANTIGPYEDVRVPFVYPLAGQATSYQSSGGIGAWVEIHPPTHVPGGGKCGVYGIGERGEGVALSNGEMNWAE